MRQAGKRWRNKRTVKRHSSRLFDDPLQTVRHLSYPSSFLVNNFQRSDKQCLRKNSSFFFLPSSVNYAAQKHYLHRKCVFLQDGESPKAACEMKSGVAIVKLLVTCVYHGMIRFSGCARIYIKICTNYINFNCTIKIIIVKLILSR